MIYQHRIVICRSGKLEQRHQQFQAVTLNALDDAGSVLIGAWEVYIGAEAGSAVWQLRQFDSLAQWEGHQQRVRENATLSGARHEKLYPHLDQVDTSIVRLADVSPSLPTTWPALAAVRGTERGYIEQRVLRFSPGTTAAHHAFYKEHLLRALDTRGATLIGLFDTLIGEGTTNADSMRSVELRRFPDLRSWQEWREAQDSDPELSDLIKARWMPQVAEMHTALLRPLDYSRIR